MVYHHFLGRGADSYCLMVSAYQEEVQDFVDNEAVFYDDKTVGCVEANTVSEAIKLISEPCNDY